MLGIDAIQWRALHSVMFKNNIRAANVLYQGRAIKTKKRDKQSRNFVWVLVSHGMVGLYGAVLVSMSQAPLVGEFTVLSLMMVLVLIGLMVESPNSMFSKKDYEALGYIPIKATTYMASKISSAMAYNALICTMIATPTLVVVFVLDGFLATIGWLLAVSLCVVFSCLAIMCLYSALVRWVSADRLRNISTATQMLGIICILSMFLVFLPSGQDGLVATDTLNLENNPGFLVFPPYWFLSAFVLVHGDLNITIATGAVLALLGSLPFAWYLSTNGSSRFFARLSDTLSSSSGELKVSNFKLRSIDRLVKLFGVEGGTVWKLAFAHIKYDQTLRNVSCSIPPLMIFYLAIPVYQGSIADPFLDTEALSQMGMINFAVMFAPLMTIDTCRISQQYRASWLLFVTPIDLAKYSRGLVDWVTIVLVLPFVLVLTVIFSFFFASPLHALMHTVTLGWLTYAMLQVKSLLSPVLPFTEYYNTSKFIARFILSLIVIGLLVAVVLYIMAEWVYRGTLSYFISLFVGIVLCGGLRSLAYQINSKRHRRLEFAG